MSLLSCATFLLTSCDWTPEHRAWLRRPTDDEWTATYKTLAHHPKIDVNAFIDEDKNDTLCKATIPQWTELKAKTLPLGWDPEEPENDYAADFTDHMTAFDYAYHALLDCQKHSNPHHAFVHRVLTVLATTGKVDLRHGFMHWHPPGGRHNCPTWFFNREWNLLWVVYLKGHHDLFLYLLQNPRSCLKTLLWAMKDMLKDHPGNALSPPRKAVTHDGALLLLRTRIWRAQRMRLLKALCRVAHAQILCARWWARARHRLFAPGGAGHKRARLSYESHLVAAR